MNRLHTIVLYIAVAVFLGAGCSSPRKASERACRKADRHLARAVWLCPDVLRVDSAAFRVQADSGAIQVHYTDPETDSLLAACERFAAAIIAERDRAIAATPATATEQPVTRPNRPAEPAPKPLPFAAEASPAARMALTAIRSAACNWTDTTYTGAHCVVTIRNTPTGPLITHALREITGKAPCPPAVQRPPCPAPGVAAWYRIGFWLLLLVTILLLRQLFLPSFTAWRNLHPHG